MKLSFILKHKIFVIHCFFIFSAGIITLIGSHINNKSLLTHNINVTYTRSQRIGVVLGFLFSKEGYESTMSPNQILKLEAIHEKISDFYSDELLNQLEEIGFKDSWGNDFLILFKEDYFLVISKGPNEKFDYLSLDDIFAKFFFYKP